MANPGEKAGVNGTMMNNKNIVDIPQETENSKEKEHSSSMYQFRNLKKKITFFWVFQKQPLAKISLSFVTLSLSVIFSNVIVIRKHPEDCHQRKKLLTLIIREVKKSKVFKYDNFSIILRLPAS